MLGPWRCGWMCLDGSHDWSLAMKRYKLLREDRLGRERVGVVLYVREQLECIKVCLGMDEVLAEFMS